MLQREVIGVCFDNHMKHINTLYGKIQGFLTLTVVIHIQDFQIWHCEKDIKWFNQWRGTQMSPRRYVLSKCHKVSRYTHNCNLIYARKKSAAFAKLIFAKLTTFRDCPPPPSPYYNNENACASADREGGGGVANSTKVNQTGNKFWIG
jgi:hypothetical protein